MGLDNLINSWVKDLTPYQPGKPIAELQRELGLTDVIKLASNENPLGPSPKAIKAMQELLNTELARYPDGNGFYLKAAIAKKYNLTEAQITLGNGSDDIFNFIVRAILQPTDNVIVDEYAFAAFPIAVRACGANIIKSPARNYTIDIESIIQLASAKSAKIVYIANPNNPTGTKIDTEDFERLLANVAKETIVVVDEAYYEYAVAYNPNQPQALNYLDKYPNLIVTRTFSKAFGLAGVRVGFSASNLAIVDVLNRIRLPFNVNSLGLVGAVAALSDDEHITKTIKANQQGLDYFYSKLQDLGLDYIPSVANFVTINVGSNSQEIFERLLQKGVIVRPLAPYAMPSHLRVSIGTKAENEKFFDIFNEIL